MSNYIYNFLQFIYNLFIFTAILANTV